MEKELEAMYEQYKERRKIITKSRPKVGLGEDDEQPDRVDGKNQNPVKSFPSNPDDRWFDRDVFKGVLGPSEKAKKQQ